MIVYWDLLANPESAHLKALFFMLYLIYMFAFGYVALLGLLATIFVREQTAAGPENRKVVSIGELSRVGALWLLHSESHRWCRTQLPNECRSQCRTVVLCPKGGR